MPPSQDTQMNVIFKSLAPKQVKEIPRNEKNTSQNTPKADNIAQLCRVFFNRSQRLTEAVLRYNRLLPIASACHQAHTCVKTGNYKTMKRFIYPKLLLPQRLRFPSFRLCFRLRFPLFSYIYPAIKPRPGSPERGCERQGGRRFSRR